MSEKLEVQVDFNSHRPTLFVGLGGAGAQAVNRISGILRRRENWREIQNIYQFFVIDTDRAMIDECPNIPIARKFIISNFDKGIYVEEKRGKLSKSKTDSDPRVIQWVHEWYNFRGSQGAGAGQIRIESRLSLYNSIESTDLIKRIEDAISQTIHISNTKVDTRVKAMNVFLYFSVAGGTGSGSNLMMAALLRHIIEQFGWSANITGVCMLPTLFLPVIRNPRQRDDILANGYAALKEIEHLMKLKVTADDPARRESRDFIFHPFIEKTYVEASPYDFVYIIDTTSDLFVDQYFRDVVADAVYLQMFSPIFAKKNSDYDNYEKNQKRLSRGLYTTHYGSFGCSLLILPNNDILDYCSVRQTVDIFRTYLSGSFIASDNKIFNAENNPDFKNSEPKQQDDLRDEAFCKFVDHEMMLEASQKVGGTKKFSLLKKSIGIREDCAFGHLLKLENIVVEELEKGESGESDSLENLMSDANYFEPWFQTEITKNIWKSEKIGISEEEDEGLYEYHKFFELRNLWEERLQDELFEKIGKVTSAHPFVDFETPFERDGDKASYRRSVQDEVAELVRSSHKRLVEINRDLSSLSEVYTQKFSNTKFIANVFSDANIAIYGQRYFALAIEKELSARKKALELINSEYNSENIRTQIEKFVSEKKDGLENLYKEAEKHLTEIRGKTEETKYRDSWGINFAFPLGNLIRDYENWQRYNFLYRVYTSVLNSVQEYLRIIREFYNNSAAPINDLEKQCSRFLHEQTEQAGTYIVNEEVLRDLTGKRLWENYYTLRIKGKFGELATEEIMTDITNVLSSDTFSNNYDRASAIQERLIRKCRDNLKPYIVGTRSIGTEDRGILINDGLKTEAEFKLVEYLQANGLWNQWKESYEKHIEFGSNPIELPKKVRELRKKIDQFSINYLNLKFQKCIRNSQLLSNLNSNDSEVVEFSCKQAMMAYDNGLYGTPEADRKDVHFPSMIAKMSPEILPVHWSDLDTSNIVVFYTAILGVPLFCFRNIIGQCKEAYNRRVAERKWDRPNEGRQYPLHIDKNWEPDDPSVDRSKLPLSPDPDEAVDQRSKSSEDMVLFFEIFIRLVHAGDIVYDQNLEVYQIPSKKLENKKGPITLGKSPREAVISLLSSIPAHGYIKNRCNDDEVPKLSRKDVQYYRDMFSSQANVDVWHDEKLDFELETTINLIDDLLQYYSDNEKKLEMKAKRAHFGKLDKPKKDKTV